MQQALVDPAKVHAVRSRYREARRHDLHPAFVRVLVAVSVEWGRSAHSAPAPADAFQLSRVAHAVHKHASGIHPFELAL